MSNMWSFGSRSVGKIELQERRYGRPVIGWIEFQKPLKPEPDPDSEFDWMTVLKVPMRSWLGNYVKFIGVWYKGFSQVKGKDINGNDFSMAISAGFRVSLKAPSNDFQYGVLIGDDDGTTLAWADDNYQLGSILDSADNISCAATQVLPVTGDSTEDVHYEVSGEVLTMYAYRIFTNDGSTDVTIKEVGLGAKYTDGTDTYYVLWERTILSEEEQYNLIAGDSVKVRYGLQWNTST